jgi:hypothetical protein
MPDTERFDDFKQGISKDFDEALAEVTAALASVPVATAVPLPGFEPDEERASEEEPLSLDPPSPVHGANSRPGQLDLWTVPDAEGMSVDDPIAAFAPDPGIDWGPRRPSLTRRTDTPKEAGF